MNLIRPWHFCRQNQFSRDTSQQIVIQSSLLKIRVIPDHALLRYYFSITACKSNCTINLNWDWFRLIANYDLASRSPCKIGKLLFHWVTENMSDSTTSHHNFEFIQSGFFYFSAERLEKNPTLLKRYRQMPVSQIDDQQYVATMIHRTCSISNEIISTDRKRLSLNSISP